MPDISQGNPMILWRAYVPGWAHDPLSGAGAARFGGRWNPVGMICLYAARELSTAWAEYNQGFVQHPATIAQLVLEDRWLADLTNNAICAELGIASGIHMTQWRDDLDNGKVPQTHRVAEHLLARGYNGVIYPSIMSPGGSCVALWRWNGEGVPTLRVIDPERRLPRGQASWL